VVAERTVSIMNATLSDKKACSGCGKGEQLDLQFTFAFQPIVNVQTRSVFAYEALVRGMQGESAYSILSQVTEQNRYQFDQACRTEAVRLASALRMEAMLSINFLPNAVYEPSTCIRTTLRACETYDFPTAQIIFEVTEGERIEDRPHLMNIFKSYSELGFQTAIDDFGAGYAGLNLLSDYQPDIVKIDMGLVRDIDKDKTRQAIVSGTVMICHAIGTLVVAEGIETKEERDYLAGIGVELMQGYLFAKPSFQSLATVEPSAWL
jgi:EAL domain-containing protein (putative c-di-GMP-specific phosphodiesterase class I)